MKLVDVDVSVGVNIDVGKSCRSKPFNGLKSGYCEKKSSMSPLHMSKKASVSIKERRGRGVP